MQSCNIKKFKYLLTATQLIGVYKHLRPNTSAYHFAWMRACATRVFFFTSEQRDICPLTVEKS